MKPRSTCPPLCLHDSLALGEVEAGLLAVKQAESELEEIKRLPVLLRLLSASRPRASIPTFGQRDEDSNEKKEIDELANEVVARLEDVAATYSVAEGVDVVACHLAPSICRNLSKVPPLKRKRKSNNTITWDTSELLLVGTNPRSNKRRRSSLLQTATTGSVSSLREDSADELNIEGNAGAFSEGVVSSDDDENPEVIATDGTNSPTNTGVASGNKSRRISRRTSEPVDGETGEDSQENLVTKTLSELASLVVSALEPIHLDSLDDSGNANHNDDVDGGNNQNYGGGSRKGGRLSLALVDSTLSEPARMSRVSADSVRGVMTGSDLGSTVASLMHHLPVLRHQHVANALCRAAVPQAGELVQRMGANVPAAVPALLRGCIDAHKSAMLMTSSRHNSSVSNSAKAAIEALSKLSEREQSRVRTVLQADGIMIDLQIKLAMRQDPTVTLGILLQNLSISSSTRRSAGVSPEAVPSRSTNFGSRGAMKSTYDTKSKHIKNGLCQVWNDVPLRTLLGEKRELLISTLSFIRNELELLLESSGDALMQKGYGRLCLLLRCYAWLMLQCDVVAATRDSKKSVDSAAVAALLSVLGNIQDKAQKVASCGPMSTKNCHSAGHPLMLLFCSSILTLARLLSQDDRSEEMMGQCEKWVESCLDAEVRSGNKKYDILVTRFACALRNSDCKACINLLKSVLLRGLSSAKEFPDFPPQLEQGVGKLCDWVKEREKEDALFLKDEIPFSSAAYADPSALLHLMSYSSDELEGLIDKIKACLSSWLSEEDSEIGFAHHQMPEFIIEATNFLASKSVNIDLNIPIVTPLQLESRAASLDLSRLQVPVSVDSNECKFLYQVLYWFAYMDSGVSSLFTFDPRILPLKEVLSSSRRLSNGSNGSSLNLYLENLISKHCPELSKQHCRWEVARQVPYLTNTKMTADRRKVKQNLCKAIKASLSNDSPDHAIAVAEKNFLVARSQLSDSELVTVVVSTLLSTPNSPVPFFTYSMICRDPLLLLKVPMQAWQYHGLRRIILAILGPLLETHEAILAASSPTDCSAEELIAARNLLILRGVLAVVSGNEEGGKSEQAPYICSMTTNFIRNMIANSEGLLATLVKQAPALPDCATDYLIEFVPETMDDAASLVSVFSERGSVASRLSAAATILRVAIAHGHRDEQVSESLVYAALAQLVSCFFLVIGPVGVPVNVLIGDDVSGQDVSQTSRRLCFRMLQSLLNVRGRRYRLKRECGLALAKLASLCKGENTTTCIAGAVASRRKALLRELFENINKAANKMGSGIDL